MQNFDVAIVGGGASGLACALQIKRLNCKLSLAVIDAGERLGKKLAATGNGQGNVSNKRLSAANYHGGGAALAARVIGGDSSLPLSIFNCLFVEDEEGRIYPAGRQASALTDSLIRELTAYDVKFIHPARVIAIDDSFVLKLSEGYSLSAEKVVLACGGKAQKQFGTDGSAYALAQKFGHKLTPLYPSLVQLKTDTTYTKGLKGIRVDCVVCAHLHGSHLCSCRGDVIFTDYGLSGNAIFKISSALAGTDGAELSLEFLPDCRVEEIMSDIIKKSRLGYPDCELLSGTLHNQVGRAVIKRSGPRPEDIVKTLKNFTLRVTGTLGFDYAQVTHGGIDCSDIGDDMQSKLAKGLYLIGEYVDVDGDCGGYNLLWAFASAGCAARSITGMI